MKRQLGPCQWWYDARLRAIGRLYIAGGAKDKAEIRGRRLLRRWLSPKQREQFDDRGYFETVGCRTRRRYRIHYGLLQNVIEIDEDGKAGSGWCFAPAGSLVPGDVMLAQKIALETNELAVLAVANRFAPSAPLPGYPRLQPFLCY